MKKASPPKARVKPWTVTIHGEEMVDNYYWLRERENPEVIQYLEKENEYLEAVMKHTETFQKSLFEEMKARMKEDDTSAPEQMGDYHYYWKVTKGKQYKTYYRKNVRTDEEEELLLDLNVFATNFDYLGHYMFKVSPNQRFLAYSIDTTGAEHYEIFIKDLVTGKIIDEGIPDTYYGLEWANDNQTLFYTKIDNKNRPYQLYSHKIGTDPKIDKLIYQEDDEAFFGYITKSKDSKYLLFSLQSQVTSEFHYLNADTPDADFFPIIPRKQNVEYSVAHQNDHFILRTNDNAQNFRIMKIPTKNLLSQTWEEIIPHRSSVLIFNFEVFVNHLVLFEKEEGLTKIRVINLSTSEDYYVDLPDEVCSSNQLSWIRRLVSLQYETNLLRFHYSSLVTPDSVFDFNMDTKERILVKETEVVGGYDSKAFTSSRSVVLAPDGEKVYISLVHKKGLIKDGNNPILLYGYGAYGSNVEIKFNSSRLSLLDRGFIFAIAHIRGSSYLGRRWYEAGKLLHKKNTFKDFILCAEHLINERFTSAEKLFIRGGSAGGLLVTAVTNMRPDLFKGVIAEVPWTDVLTDMLDPSLPLVVIEFEEWGNPQNKEYFEYMRSYSPYDNITEKSYPNLLITAGLNDPRVMYWSPAKMTAKLRQYKTDKNLLLLKTNMGTGHFGKSGRYDYLKDIALIFSFMFDLLGEIK